MRTVGQPAHATTPVVVRKREKNKAPPAGFSSERSLEEVNWTHQLLKVDQVVVERLISLVDEGDVCKAVMKGQSAEAIKCRV